MAFAIDGRISVFLGLVFMCQNSFYVLSIIALFCLQSFFSITTCSLIAPQSRKFFSFFSLTFKERICRTISMVLFGVLMKNNNISSSPHYTLRRNKQGNVAYDFSESTGSRLYLFHRFCSYKTLSQRKTFGKDQDFLELLLFSAFC